MAVYARGRPLWSGRWSGWVERTKLRGGDEGATEEECTGREGAGGEEEERLAGLASYIPVARHTHWEINACRGARAAQDFLGALLGL